MRKSKIVSGCIFVVLAGILLWQTFGASDPARENLYEDFGAWLDHTVLADRELDARRAGINRFLGMALDIESALAADRLTLEEAVTQILAAAIEHYPEHLDWMARFEKGNTPEERIARNIARHIEEDAEQSQNEALRERVRQHLAELLKKYQKTPGPMVGAMAA